jgi:hypothetical protein
MKPVTLAYVLVAGTIGIFYMMEADYFSGIMWLLIATVSISILAQTKEVKKRNRIINTISSILAIGACFIGIQTGYYFVALGWFFLSVLFAIIVFEHK